MGNGTQGRKSSPTRMDRTARGFALALAAMAGTTAVVAQEAPARTSQIYQHRTADGRIVLSDRPVAGAQLQRTWNIANEDTVAARERSEKGRLEAQAVSERIQRQLDADRQRADAQEAERLRVALAEARRDAEVARQAARETAVYVPPGWGWGWGPRPPQVRPLPPSRPGPVRPSPGTRWPPVGS